MAENASALRLKFLQNSANLLGSSGVSTAAHLMTLHNRLIHADFKPLKPRQHESWCGACGSFRDSAHTKVSKTKRKITSRKPEPESRDISEEVVVYQCLRCHKQTVRRLQSYARQQRESSSISIDTQPKAPLTNQLLSTLSTTPGPAPSAANMSSASATALDNASSKKRAKARKQGGLQALMASKQRSQASSGGSSLDLLDFLQQ